jgi:hypothetical protein
VAAPIVLVRANTARLLLQPRVLLHIPCGELRHGRGLPYSLLGGSRVVALVHVDEPLPHHHPGLLYSEGAMGAKPALPLLPLTGAIIGRCTPVAPTA